MDADALYGQIAGPHYEAVLRRLRTAVADGEIRGDAGVEAVTEAIIGTTLYLIFNDVRTVEETIRNFDGLVEALLGGYGQHGHRDARPAESTAARKSVSVFRTTRRTSCPRLGRR